uniref:Cytochrome P450 2C13, male-specific n=1 Tax=Phallusia mammillata TaxID=59560 RepID=A0A6F9DAZ5_9ASCI|nr:cytochrome P450 2C13, male-specific [Phallusia mammillata]
MAGSQSNNEELRDLPGPWGFPIVGSALSLIKYKEKSLSQWAEEDYGDVYKVRFGPTDTLVINGFEAFQEAFIEKATAYSGRLEAKVLKAARDNKGLFFKQYDDLWTKWRKFARESFTDIWHTIEDGIVTETEHLQESLSKLEGESDIKELVLSSMANVVMQTCFSRRYEATDSALNDLVTLVYADIRDPKFTVLFLVPWLGRLPSMSRFISNADSNRQKIIKKLLALADERTAENRDTPDFVTSFYKVFENPTREEKEFLAVLMEDFVFAGSTTTASAFLWVVLFMMKNPETKKRMQQELDNVLKGCPSPVRGAITHKKDELHYTRAVIEESFRLRPIAPTSLFHYVQEDTSLMGYKVPKGMAVMPNIWSVHYDKKFWAPDPETFRAERHLDQSGAFKKSGHVIPFGIGWRSCVGQRIAETEILADVVAMFYKFDVTIAASDANVDMAGDSAAILSPYPFKLKFTPRN